MKHWALKYDTLGPTLELILFCSVYVPKYLYAIGHRVYISIFFLAGLSITILVDLDPARLVILSHVLIVL